MEREPWAGVTLPDTWGQSGWARKDCRHPGGGSPTNNAWQRSLVSGDRRLECATTLGGAGEEPGLVKEGKTETCGSCDLSTQPRGLWLLLLALGTQTGRPLRSGWVSF